MIPKTKKSAAAKRSQRKNDLIKNTLNQVKNSDGLQDMSQQQIIKAFANKDDKVMLALKDLEAKISKIPKTSIISQGQINSYALKKSHTKNLAELRKALGAEAKDIPNDVLTQLVALDDWGSIFKAALPHIINFGAPYVRKLYERHIRPLLGGDEGFNPIDWAGSALAPFRYSPAEGLNVFTPSTKSRDDFSSGPTDVSTHSMAVSICPEMYKHRLTSMALYKSALGYITTQYAVTSNSNGQFGLVILPDACHVVSFMYVFNDSTFNPATGAQTPNSSSYPGPFYAQQAAIRMIRMCQMSVEVQPSISYNTPGMISMGYNTNFNGSSYTNDMRATISDVRTFPFNTGGNAKVIYRMITPFSNPSDLDFVDVTTSGLREGFMIFGTGFGSQVTMNIVINTVVEFLPTKDYIPLCPMQYPQSGSQTLAFLTQAFAKFPVLQQLTLKDASRVATALINGPSDFNSLMRVLQAALDGITLTDAPHANSQPSLSMPGDGGAIFAFE